MKRIWRVILTFIAFSASLFLIIFLLDQLTPRPPVDEVENARRSLSYAVKNKADTYSKKLYAEAKNCYDSAFVNWQKQNTRFLYFREYDKVVWFAKLSSQKAIEAAENSVNNTTTLKFKVDQKIDTLNKLVAEINELFSTYPLEAETRNRISTGKMLLHEAEIIFNEGQYLKANRKITDSEYLLTTSYENGIDNLKNYFQSYSVWKKWADRTIRESKKNKNYSFIIDKFSRKFLVYNNGIKKYEFEAELGKNWVGDKRVRGDYATPEGMYKILKKFDSRKTKYYKALLLDYPNEEDRTKFNSDIASGALPPSSRIGGLIEIHGNGGKGIDWTEGCIALTDKEMDIVYRIALPGTPVTIVGSMDDLPKLIKPK